MNISRIWAMPNSNTFGCFPIGDFVIKYLHKSKVSVDPFARNSQLATYRNDLNPNTVAEYHMDSVDFLKMLAGEGIKADLGILDPPYSVRQMSECYQSIGRKTSMVDSQGMGIYKYTRDALDQIMQIGGIVLSFGWNSIGMGLERYYQIEEILLVCHGGAHNDTICMAERKIAHQDELGLK